MRGERAARDAMAREFAERVCSLFGVRVGVGESIVFKLYRAMAAEIRALRAVRDAAAEVSAYHGVHGTETIQDVNVDALREALAKVPATVDADDVETFLATCSIDNEGRARVQEALSERLSAGGLAVPPGGDS